MGKVAILSILMPNYMQTDAMTETTCYDMIHGMVLKVTLKSKQ